MSVRLDKLLNEVDLYDRPENARKVEIENITDNTADVRPGSLFCCVVGSSRDGHDLARDAVAKGAVALLVERDLDIPVPQARVSDVRASLAPVAAAFWGHPDKQLRIVGITGTNGKTTTTHILSSILQLHHWKSASIGTLTGVYTSPPAPELQAMLARLRDSKHQAVVMEVSSHALIQRRVDSIRFRAAVFTNLTQDHLDYHGTMSAYFEAKSLLFDPGRSERSIINIDDSWGRQLIERIAGPATPYSLGDCEDLVVGPTGSTFGWHGESIELPLVGTFNVHNALAAATTARELGVSTSVIAKALNAISPVPGRLEAVDRGQPFSVFVDFAHTPDGLENVLHVSRKAAEQRNGRVLVLFGCGGDRDAAKRPQMGIIAESLADVVFVTTDNARSESPTDIANQILGGMQQPGKAHVELDRHKAIEQIISDARPGDVVLIAGKGHETTQDIGGVKTAFDDRLIAASVIDRLQTS